MQHSEQLNEIATALAKAQGEMPTASKDSDNPFFKSKYADLASVQKAYRPYLSKHGIADTQIVNTENEKTFLTTMLIHSSGQWIKSVIELNPTKKDAQGYGSVITYMRRYCASAITGVAQEDDDGNAASSTKEKQSFNMAYDPEQNKEAYDHALKTISGFDSVDKLETYYKSNKNKLNKLPKDMFDDVMAAFSTHKTDLIGKMNGAH